MDWGVLVWLDLQVDTVRTMGTVDVSWSNSPHVALRYRIDLDGQRYAMKVQRPGLNRALAMDVVILSLGDALIG